MAVPVPSVVPRGEYVPAADQRVVMHGISWEQFEAQLAIRGERTSTRVAYLDGAMELMSPSKEHERIKSYLGLLIGIFAEETGIELSPYGSWTLREAPKRAGLEPDECYLIGPDQDRSTPDLVIEVVWTSGGIDKLEAYRRLGVSEVWFWQNGSVHVYLLEQGTYVRSDHSRSLPSLKPSQLATFLEYPTATQAMRAFRASLKPGA
jgi:Uma2 family endonuclease